MRFSKWHGLGNDYLLVERAEAGRPLEPALVRRLCDYHVGIGSDGILEILSADAVRRLCDHHRGVGADGIVEVVSSEDAHAEILIWNPDGSTAELSGNGTRIAARWLGRRSSAERVVIRTGTREVAAGAA